MGADISNPEVGNAVLGKISPVIAASSHPSEQKIDRSIEIKFIRGAKKTRNVVTTDFGEPK